MNTKTSKPSLRWGLICTASINRALIPAIRAAQCSELAAVASRDPARALDCARAWAIPRAHGSYQALLDDPDVDVVYNALPNSLHGEWTVKAADAGKHVLCEKPLALTLQEVDRIVEAARRNQVVVLEAMMYRYHPQTLKVQELLRQGAIGEVRLVRAVFSFTLNLPDAAGVPPIIDPAMGGGSLWDVGCYPVSFAQAVAGGAPLEVFGWKVPGRTGVDLTFAGAMRFANGVLAQFDSSFQSAERWSAEVIGSRGSLYLDEPWRHRPEARAVIRLQRGGGEEKVIVENRNAYLCEVEALTDRILYGAEPPYSLADSQANIATINALFESAQRGEAVRGPG
jgi:xylose dehydrogenase (NAD/NADP)